MTLVQNPPGTIVFAPDLPPASDPRRAPWRVEGDPKLVVSILLHAAAYRDDVPAGAVKPLAMQGGVGRETGEPRHGQIVRLSQWDFGLTVGIWRLLDIAHSFGLPAAVALDAYGVDSKPGLARLAAERADEIVVRGHAANVIISSSMTTDDERSYIASATRAVTAATGRDVSGWFSPERGSSSRTTSLLREAGYDWFGDWPIDEHPVALDGASVGLTSVPFSLEVEDMFALYTRNTPFPDYERAVVDTVEQLIADADILGTRYLGLSWFGWVLGQACFADVAERILARLAADPRILVVVPGRVAAL